mmetsp:Transcript_3952/g.7072  ORF Transcript_3952/g.7072 Transcript_3952/m.7072 type:complete len:195 (-) Transcript_3952:72-656(-)
MKTINMEKMRCFLAHGAGSKDHETRRDLIRRFIVPSNIRDAHGPDDFSNWRSNYFIGGKRIITLESFEKLNELGFDISENDCKIIDEDDRRTCYRSFMCAQRTKERLNSGKALSDIDDVQEKMEFMFQTMQELNGYINTDEARVSHCQKKLEGWLNVDSSAHIVSIGKLREARILRLFRANNQGYEDQLLNSLA